MSSRRALRQDAAGRIAASPARRHPTPHSGPSPLRSSRPAGCAPTRPGSRYPGEAALAIIARARVRATQLRGTMLQTGRV